MVKSISTTLSASALDKAFTSIALCETKPSPERLPSIFSFRQFSDGNATSVDAAHLLPQLLDQLAVLGDLARQISQGLGGNGHRPEAVRELIEELTKR